MQGKKETDGKLPIEFDWEFLEGVLSRIAQNKGKYEPYNWTKPMDIDKLKESLFRHTLEVMKGNLQDENDEFGHLFALVCNAMFIFRQEKNVKTGKSEIRFPLLGNIIGENATLTTQISKNGN